MAHNKGTDFLPAVTGFIAGGCVLFALVFGIVTLVNHSYASETHAEASR